MLDIRKVMTDVFGKDNSYSIPSGAALVYMIRRFGYTPYGSDDYKRLCNYYLETKIDGLSVRFAFGGTSCFIRAAPNKEMTVKISNEYYQPLREWWQRCNEWASTQGKSVYVDSWDDLDLYITQAEAWLLTQGVPVDHEMTEEEFTEKWMDKYGEHCRQHNEKLRVTYSKIEPFPEADRETEFTLSCKEAIKETLEDLLRPVHVRDVLINILGQFPEPEYDFERDERYEVGEVERSHIAGYGVPQDAYEDPELFIDFIDYVRKKLGGGNLQDGMRLILERGNKEQSKQVN